MKIRITDRYELRTSDALNMQLYELRPIADRHSTKRAGAVDWCATGNYFQDVRSAVEFVYKLMQRQDGYDGDLSGALERLEQIAESLQVDN